MEIKQKQEEIYFGKKNWKILIKHCFPMRIGSLHVNF